MVVKCEIKFDNNPNGIYFAGQTLSGIVELTLNKPKKIRGIVLKIEGFAKVEWIDADQSNVKNSPTAVNKNGKTQNEKIKFRGHEDYMNTTTYLIGGPDALATTELAPGSYQYDFQSVLPSLLPTSFEAKHGAIRYNINVILERPWKNNLTFKSGFTVLKHLDLNYENPALKIPTKMEEQKSFYCGFCKTNPIYLAASIPMSGYVSGQSILVSIQINNQSSIDVESLKVSLIEIIFYNSQVPEKRTKNETITISEINCGKVNKKCSTTFDQTLNIPALPPSNMNYCRILNVAYEVWVVAKMSGFHSDSTIKIPITLGTIPLNLATPIPSAPPTIANLSPLPIANVINQHTSMTYTNEIPPPNYQQAIVNETPVQFDDDETNSRPYNPMYPVYSFGNGQTHQQMSSKPVLVVNY